MDDNLDTMGRFRHIVEFMDTQELWEAVYHVQNALQRKIQNSMDSLERVVIRESFRERLKHRAVFSLLYAKAARQNYSGYLAEAYDTPPIVEVVIYNNSLEISFPLEKYNGKAISYSSSREKWWQKGHNYAFGSDCLVDIGKELDAFLENLMKGGAQKGDNHGE
jgi:hypothetical protein